MSPDLFGRSTTRSHQNDSEYTYANSQIKDKRLRCVFSIPKGIVAKIFRNISNICSLLTDYPLLSTSQPVPTLLTTPTLEFQFPSPILWSSYSISHFGFCGLSGSWPLDSSSLSFQVSTSTSSHLLLHCGHFRGLCQFHPHI